MLGYLAVAPYRISTKPVRDIAKELGVDAIESDAVVRAGDVVSLSANRALDARDVDPLQVLNAMPALHPFRQEARYQDLTAASRMEMRRIKNEWVGETNLPSIESDPQILESSSQPVLPFGIQQF